MEYKIKNPVTKRYIYIGGDTYNKLINQGVYTKEELLSLPQIKADKPMSPKYKHTKINTNDIITNEINVNKPFLTSNTNIELNDDIMNEIVYYINDIDTIINICMTNKKLKEKCDQFQFWNPILKYHQIDLPVKNFNTSCEWIKYIKKQMYINNRINEMILKDDRKYFCNIDEINKPYTKVNDQKILNVFSQLKIKKLGATDIMEKSNNSRLIITTARDSKNDWYIDFYHKQGLDTYKMNIYTLKILLKELIDKDMI